MTQPEIHYDFTVQRLRGMGHLVLSTSSVFYSVATKVYKKRKNRRGFWSGDRKTVLLCSQVNILNIWLLRRAHCHFIGQKFHSSCIFFSSVAEFQIEKWKVWHTKQPMMKCYIILLVKDIALIIYGIKELTSCPPP